MKIDLHCHTKSIKNGDGAGRNVTVDVFKEKISNADVKIVAITNHNSFDIEQYNEFKEAVRDFCQVWPGIEIDVNGLNNEKYHLIVVANPNNVDDFNMKIKELYDGKDIKTCHLEVGRIYEKLNDCDVIYIPHLHKKNGIPEKDQTHLMELVGNPSRVFGEPSNNRSLGVFANHNYNVIIGSDVKDWNEYEKLTFAELKLPVESFSQFCLLSERDSVVVETLLNKKKSYFLTAKPYKTVSLELKIYNDINIIFGQKGTGKSEIIKSLYENLIAQGISCRRYLGAERDDEFKKVLRTNDMERDLAIIDVEDCKSDFLYLRDWEDEIPTSFVKYLEWYERKDRNKYKRSMKITEATSIPDRNPENYKQYLDDKNNIKKVLNCLNKIAFSLYFQEEEEHEFKRMLAKLTDKNLQFLSSDIIDIYAVKLANYTIDKIKEIADRNSDCPSKPSSTGFFDYAMNRLKLQISVNKLFSNIENKEYSEKSFLGEIEEKGKVYVRKRYRMLMETSTRHEFNVGITILRKITSLLKEIREKVSYEALATTVDDFNELCREQNIDSLKPFLGLSKQIVTEDDEEYSPSNGEKGILLLQELLRADVDSYFLDEPELGMGNSYIDSIIRPQLSKLAQRNKTVVIATHNANIAVRTLPYMSVFRAHKNGNYYTYTGNPFNDKLVNVEDETDVRSWTSESLHTLEGGKEAFYERKNIYESNND